jgi:hypothetical protein
VTCTRKGTIFSCFDVDGSERLERVGGRSGSLTGRDWGGGHCSGDSIGGKRPRRLNLDNHRCEAGEAREACDLMTTSSEMTSQSDITYLISCYRKQGVRSTDGFNQLLIRSRVILIVVDSTCFSPRSDVLYLSSSIQR